MVFWQKVVSAILFAILLSPIASFAENKTGKAPATKKVAQSPVKELRRLDFRLKGSKCASCLGRIRKRMAHFKGVIKAAVILKKPYGAAAIYDGGVTNAEEIKKAALKGEKVKVEIAETSDKKINKLPLILVPHINQLVRKSQK